nr:uncharacterized protein LOC126518196 [Dermacentor andersoni]
MQSRLNLFVFFMQVFASCIDAASFIPSTVSRYRNSCEFKSDSHCLVLLPCPGVLLKCFTECFDSFCLLALFLSGGVELNPGPGIAEQLEEILQNEKASSCELNAIGVKVDSHITAIEGKLDVLSQTAKRMETCEQSLAELNEEIASLRRNVHNLENYSRRNNLLVYGIQESEAETVNSLKEHLLTEMFERKLEIKVESLESLHRLGRKAVGKVRPVIIRFSDFTEKAELLRNASKLKGTQTYTSEDFSPRLRKIR